MKAPERTYPGRSVGIPLRMVQASQRHLRPIRYRLCSSQFAICRASDAIFSLRPASMALPLPTRRLVKRLVEEIPAFDRYTARYGHDAALRRFRSVEGHRVTHEPLERAEIDHTNLDLFAIDDETLLPLGRPKTNNLRGAWAALTLPTKSTTTTLSERQPLIFVTPTVGQTVPQELT